MAKKSLMINTFLSAVLICSGVTLAQDPVRDIDQNRHPELAAAQGYVVQASGAVLAHKSTTKETCGDTRRRRGSSWSR